MAATESIGALVVIVVVITIALIYGFIENVTYPSYIQIKGTSSLHLECDSFDMKKKRYNFSVLDYSQNVDISKYENDTHHDRYYSRNCKVGDNADTQLQLPSLLSNYHNPCWYEKIPDGFSYLDPYWSYYFSLFEDPVEAGARNRYKLFCPVEKRLHRDNPTWRLRCFPRFFLIGFPKCGTTDLNVMLQLHPWIAQTRAKEPSFWNIYRFKESLHRIPALSDYIDLFDQSSDQLLHQYVRPEGDVREYHPGIFGDCDPKTACQLASHYPPDSSEPHSTSADVIHSIYPEAKLIVMMRDPVDRFISHYRMFNSNANETTGQEFHIFVKRCLRKFNRCISKYSLRYCAYLMKGYTWTSLTYGLYEIFLSDWLKRFPKENFLFIKSENYFKQRPNVMGKLYDFLHLNETLPDYIRALFEDRGPANQMRRTSQVLNRTKEMLKEFYRPFNQRLVNLLGSEQFNWYH